ncbi:MAG TPA: sigma-70 family RNA polymerase sigma factor [Blastocatellia bacterium]|nr:sigma-70 family RNA polymerase sigma factor [Blastocatellia bacterium]
MSSPDPQQITQLLLAWGQGNEAARDQLIPLIYDELRRLARKHLRRERPGHTLQTSALVNEAYLRMAGQSVSWQGRAHFFGIAARLMRQILVDHARLRDNAKHGGDWRRVSLDAADVGQDQTTDILALDEALQALAQMSPQQSRVIELRFFGGLTIAETAEVLGVSHSTVEREWRVARAWLWRELQRK